MIRRIVLCDRTVDYDFCRKSVKNINLRIRPDGTVTVSAPHHVPMDTVERFLRSQAASVLKALDRFAAQQTAPPCLEDGDTVPVLGERCCLCVQKGLKNTAVFENGTLTLTVKDPEDIELKTRVYQAWRKQQTIAVVTSLCRQCHTHFAADVPLFPTLKFRFMTSRWGSCRPKTGVLTFHAGLIDQPLEGIELVVYHEFAHFRHPDHSAAFYQTLSRYIPDWKERQKRLGDRR